MTFDYDIKQKTVSSYELQCLDCNCNNCGYFIRDIEKTKRLNTNPQIVNNKVHYGRCEYYSKEVGEIANILLLHTQECFVHRKDMDILLLTDKGVIRTPLVGGITLK